MFNGSQVFQRSVNSVMTGFAHSQAAPAHNQGTFSAWDKMPENDNKDLC